MVFFKRKERKQIEAYQNELMKIHYSEVENMYKDMRGWRHDFKNHLQVLKGLSLEAEAEIYQQLNQIVGDKTAIFISHRLSSCRFADRIVVFHKGQIKEEGVHDDLVAEKNSKYFELWNSQAQYYV